MPGFNEDPDNGEYVLGGTDDTKIGNVSDSLKVLASQSTAAAASGAWPVKVTDGTNTTAVKAASTAPVATDPAAVVALSPNGNQATAANQSTEITALQLIDNPVGSVAAGTAGTSSYLIGGVYNTTLPTMTNGQQAAAQMDSNGKILVKSFPVDGDKATYSAAISTFASGTLATDIFTLTGSATKTVRILKVQFSGTTGAANNVSIDFSLIKRSTADTAGTSTSPTAVPHDSANAAATATVKAYTVNPTLGATVGTILADRISLPKAGVNAGISGPTYLYNFGVRPGQAVVLRGTSEVLALNIGGVTLNSPILSITIEWTEES